LNKDELLPSAVFLSLPSFSSLALQPRPDTRAEHAHLHLTPSLLPLRLTLSDRHAPRRECPLGRRAGRAAVVPRGASPARMLHAGGPGAHCRPVLSSHPHIPSPPFYHWACT
jgi:hypothetical protein